MTDFEQSSFYQEWVGNLPNSFRESPLWRLHVYREAAFLHHLAWHDVQKLQTNESLRPVAGQLYRAVGSIGANFAEGFGRNSARDRIRLWEYALTSAQESQHWYISVQYVLTSAVIHHRVEMMSSITRQITALIPHQRNLREEAESYNSETEETDSTFP